MTNVEKFLKYQDGCELESKDVYTEDNFTATKLWLVSDGKRIPGTTVFTIYEDGDGDYPLVETLGEAKKMIVQERVARGDLVVYQGYCEHYQSGNDKSMTTALKTLVAKLG